MTPERSRDHLIEVSLFRLVNGKKKETRDAMVVVDKDDTVLTLKWKLCDLGFGEGLVCTCERFDKTTGKKVHEELLDNYMVSYYCEDGEVVCFHDPLPVKSPMVMVLDVSSDSDSQDEGIMIEEEEGLDTDRSVLSS